MIFVLNTLVSHIFSNFADVDECGLRPSPCSQGCVNTDGSYLCTCQTGYRLSGFQCIGKILLTNAMESEGLLLDGWKFFDG